jgi:signal transduction histidine kinase
VEKGSQLDYLKQPSTMVWLTVWCTSLILVLAAAVVFAVHNQRVDFEKDANSAISHIQQQIVTNDVALAGFGSLLSTIGVTNLQQTRQFTKRMRDAYPHIYMFEALVSIDPSNKAQHEERMANMGYQNYKISSYVAKKTPMPLAPKVRHTLSYPIVFIDPSLDAVKGILGFDMMSVASMRDTILASTASGKPAASIPFKLREGGTGYALIKVLDMVDRQSVMEQRYVHGGGLAALLIIKTDTILAPVADIIPAATVQLLYGKERTLAADKILPNTTALPLVEIETLILERDLDALGQSFTVSISTPAGLYADQILQLTLIFLLIVIAYALVYRALVAKYRLRLQRDAGVIKLSEQHDNLEVMVHERTTELQRQVVQNTQLAQQLIRVQEDQVHHIARELHDEFGQTLTAIKINAHILENAKSIELVGRYAKDITNQADGLYMTMRDMIQRLRPESLDMFGLKVAIEQCLLAFHLDEQNIELELRIDDSVNDVEEIYSIASYRIVQELANNAIKYAKLTKLKVSLEVINQHMHIVVEDNGIGFDPLEHKLGFGLSGVDERVRSLGGTVDISTVVGEGVKIDVSIPLEAC